MAEKNYRIEDARKLLGVSVRSMYRYISEKKLRATKIGHWRISEADIKRFIAERTNIRKHK